MKFTKETAAIVFSSVLFFIFLIQIIAPLILNSGTQILPNNSTQTEQDIVLGVYNGEMIVIGLKETLIITNSDKNLNDLISNQKKNYNIIYADEDQNGYTIIFRNSKNITDFIKIIPSNYTVYVTASLLLKNGSQFLANGQIITIDKDITLQGLLDRESLENNSNTNLSFILEVYMSKSTKEILQIVSLIPEEKTEYREVSFKINNIKTISISETNDPTIYEIIRGYANKNNITYSVSDNKNVKISFQNQELTEKFFDELIKNISINNKPLRGTIVATIIYDNRTYDVVLKDIDLSNISLNSSITQNATLAKIGKKILSLSFN